MKLVNELKVVFTTFGNQVIVQRIKFPIPIREDQVPQIEFSTERVQGNYIEKIYQRGNS